MRLRLSPNGRSRRILFVVAHPGGFDAIFTTSEPLIRAVQQATATVPLVAFADDLVARHPGGNTTGVSILGTELNGKRQQLLLELGSRRSRRISALADAGGAP